MTTILTLTIVVLAVIIALMYEHIKDLKTALINVAPAESHIPPTNVDRMVNAQQYWSQKMTEFEETVGKDHWSYEYAQKQLAECTASLIKSKYEDLDQLNKETN